jgi:hypothetical protein
LEEAIHNLLTVAQNSHNDPNAIRAAHKTLGLSHRGHPDVEIYFARIAEIESAKKLRDRALALKKIF